MTWDAVMNIFQSVTTLAVFLPTTRKWLLPESF